MRRAAAADARRRVHQRKAKHSPVFRNISIDELSGFEGINFEPNSSLFAICGGTGVGKSTLLELISGALKPHQKGQRPHFRQRLGKPGIVINVDVASGVFSREIKSNLPDTIDGEGFEPEHRLVTLSERTEVLQNIFDEIDPSIAIEGSDPRSLGKDDLLLLSRVVGKKYSEVLCFEVEDPDFEDEIVPYFVVKEVDIEYDLRSMGTGELSALYIMWVLGYVKRWSILLIEEPEAMLPPSSHLSLFDIICVKALERNLAIVIATHSPDIVSEIPINQVLPLSRFDGVTSGSADREMKNDALSNLGLVVHKSALIMVEDELALTVATELISRFDPHLMQRVEIRQSGSGFGAIKLTLENLPVFESIKILGLLDGDMEERAVAWPCKASCSFLPFKSSMEMEFLDAIRQDKTKFSQATGREIRRVERGLQKADSVDPHDGFKDFCKEVGLPEIVCGMFALAQWLELGGGNGLCAALCAELRAKLNIK